MTTATSEKAKKVFVFFSLLSIPHCHTHTLQENAWIFMLAFYQSSPALSVGLGIG